MSLTLSWLLPPLADPGKVPELPWFGHFTLGLGVVVSFLISVYFLAKFRHIGPW
jgi:hypothetical protein